MKLEPVTLTKPIQVDGQEVSVLNLREPTLGALDNIEITVNPEQGARFNLGDLHKIVADMADIPPSSARQIGIIDGANVAAQVVTFLGEFLPTGGE